MLKILGYDYFLYQESENNMGDDYGSIDCIEQKIKILNSSNDQFIISSILHEIIEGINTHLSLNLNHDVILMLETSLFSVLKENDVDLKVLLKKFDNPI